MAGIFAGAWVMVLLHDYISGVETLYENPEISFRMEAITRDNISYFVDVLGNRDWGSLDFKEFSIANSPPGTEYNFVLHPGDGQEE